MPNVIEIGVGSRKFSKKLVDLTRNDPSVKHIFMPTPFHLGQLRLLGARVTLRAVRRGKQRASQLMKRRITATGGKVALRGSVHY